MMALVPLLIALAAAAGVVLAMVDVALGAWERVAEVPEVAGAVSDRKGQALLALIAALAIATLAYLVDRNGLWVLVLFLVLVAGVLAVGAHAGRPPHGLPRRVSWRLGLWPMAGPLRLGGALVAGVMVRQLVGLELRLADPLVSRPSGRQAHAVLGRVIVQLQARSYRPPRRLRWVQRTYLGWSRGRLHRWRLAAGRREDTVGILGPPRSGKTMGLIVPQALLWDGPLVSTSIKSDVLRATAGRRRELARRHGGEVYVYAPTSTGLVEGLRPIRWSLLAGCRDDHVARLRVEALVEAANLASDVEHQGHFRSGAKLVLRGFFLAAAHHPLWPGDLSNVKRWVASQDPSEAIKILEGVQTPGAKMWAGDLRGLKELNWRERSSFYSIAGDALQATSDPAVMASCAATELDVERFLLTRSTLYVVSPSEDQRSVAPLIAALIESIITTAYELHRDGRLPARLLVSLDELANIAPLPNLGTHVSQGAGQGVNISWAVQSHAQLRDSYGEDTAEAIWSASTAKLVFGGLADDQHLQRVSHLVGEHRVKTKTTTVAPIAGSVRVATHTSHGFEWRPRLTVAELRGLRPSWVLLLYHDRKAYCLRAPIAQHRRLFRRGLLPWRPPAEEEQRRPHLEVLAEPPEERSGDTPRELPDSDQEADA
jgi:type IV secretion system protein VirD4